MELSPGPGILTHQRTQSQGSASWELQESPYFHFLSLNRIHTGFKAWKTFSFQEFSLSHSSFLLGEKL